MVYKRLFNPIKFNLTFSLLILNSIVFLCRSTVQVHAEQVNGPKGVAKSEAHLYEKKGSTWMCLDGSATIPYEAINDDYCDCADGSDEPGTSACPNGKFYCTNAGHISSYISSKRVNDGVCEPECCDGSDEYDGKVECPNICGKVGAEYRKVAEQLAKTRAEGAKIKSEYIKYGKTSKQQLESELNRLKTLLVSVKTRVAERQAALKKVQEKEKAGSKTNDRVRIQKCQEKIRMLREREERLHEQVDTLLNILKDMKKDHNPNYHDMAVVDAIKGYDEFMEEHEAEVEENMESGQEDEFEEYEVNEAAPQVPEIEMSSPSLSERISKAFLDVYNDLLEIFGMSGYVIRKPERQFSRPSNSGNSNEAVAFDKAEEEKNKVENDIKEIDKKLAKDYGPQREFAKLDGECFDYDTKEYTYTICMFEKATQKSNKDHSSTHLGNFEKWIGAESKEDYKYYKAQLYENGIKCWNGPNRSVKLYFECDTENKILSVSEPEKCEYIVKMTTPAVCSEKIEENKNEKSNHEEL